MRRLLRSGVVLVCLVGAVAAAGEGDLYGAEANPTGDPIGGGEGYRAIVEEADVTVDTVEALVEALGKAQPGQVVMVASGAELNFGARNRTRIPEGVTLAGDRGRDGAPGPLLYGPELPEHGALLVASRGVRVTGLRIKGPDRDFPDIDYDVEPRSYTDGIDTAGPDVEVDNCEIMNFHHGGVNVHHTNVHVHHCHIHEVHAYPVCVCSGVPPVLIEANEIHWVWHTVAGTGIPGTGYEARYNLVIRDTPPASWGGEDHHSHGWDMHGGRKTRKHGLSVAGDQILIHHNTMRNTNQALAARIRGVPREIADLHHNWFSEPDVDIALQQLVRDDGAHGNIWVHENVYGPEKKLVEVAPQTTPQIVFVAPPGPNRNMPAIAEPIALNVQVRAFPPRTLKRVTVSVDDEEVYAGEAAPEPGELTIDPKALGEGRHTVTLFAEDSASATAKHITDFTAP